MPKEQEWLAYERWAATYGDIVHLQVGTQHILLLNTYEAAFELLERRSTIYSDRADFIMVNEFAGFSWSPSTMRYGPVWRQHRALLHRMFHPTACDAYISAQTRHAHALLRRIVHEETDNPFSHIKHAVGALIMETTYGIHVKPKDDPWLNLCDAAIEIFSRVTVPGSFLVDAIPALRHVPEWMPGAGWKRQAREWKKLVTRLADAPFEYVLNSMKDAENDLSIVSQLLTDYPDPEQALAIRNVGAIIYAAGADTTAAILQIFILAMVLHPEAQRAAQVELDALQRLPTLADRPQLPYMDALLKEVLRWHPVQPLNGGHVSTEEDEFRGYRIPKGATLHSNNWVMFRDPNVYGPDVDAFRPERFMVPDPPRDASAVFGLGRRACPGRFFADNTVFIFASCILAVFNILPDKDGPPVEPRFKSGFFSPPEPFKCRIAPRSPDALRLVLQTGADVE
ncbi:cytochrome P450 [Auricularia subglabra TFB-10046 SS5]|nr:cytochrome P450 [Auricularia subglabra TFB-10046 SS5]